MDPLAFAPERWLVPEVAADRAPSIAFGNGARSCMGISLAFAEMKVCIFQPLPFY